MAGVQAIFPYQVSPIPFFLLDSSEELTFVKNLQHNQKNDISI